MEHVEITKTVMVAKPGSSIGQCMKDGLEIAVGEWRNVQLIHNDKTYEINVLDLIGTIKESDA